MPLATKIRKMMTDLERLVICYSNFWSRGLARSHDSHYISTNMIPMATKLGKMVTHTAEGLT